QAQIAAFRAWERPDGSRFEYLHHITHPALVVNGIFDNMIPVRNSYYLAEHLPNAVLLVYPDAGHGSLFQYPESFTHQASLFLDGELQ
ncbi:MAG TPA: alpha/beta hydrolase, partial [Gemmatimonadales bacterium]